MRVLTVISLLAGAVFGMAGTSVSSDALRGVLWGLDGTSLVVAASLLTMRYFRMGNDLAAAGFLTFAVGQGLIDYGSAMSLERSVPGFGAGVALWAAALLMTSFSGAFAVWIRATSWIAAALFGVTALRILSGELLLPTAEPLPSFAYPFLVLTIIGWSWTLCRRREANPSA